jgi:hypothetical protein
MSRWFRFYDEALDDPKVQLLTPELFKAWVNLLCMANRGDGVILNNEALAWHLRCKPERVGLFIDALVEKGLIEDRGDCFVPHNWDKWQHGDRPPAHEWAALRATVFERDDYTCKYCGERGKALECDHIHPVARGGSHDLTNLVTACRPCNRDKRDKTIEEWTGGLRLVAKDEGGKTGD